MVEELSGKRETPALVLGRGFTALGALRSLVAAGVPAFVACPADDLVTHSRWYRPPPGAEHWDGTPGPVGVAALRAMALPRAVLIPGADDAALWLAGLVEDEELAARFPVSTSSRATLDILQDKARFGEFLALAGIPHPRTYTIGSLADISRIPFDELDRVFIKPADSQSFSRVLGAKGIWAKRREEFESIWRKLDDDGFKVIAQEYIPGSGADHYFVDGFRSRSGIFSGLFARRRTRLFPADFGNSSYCHSVALGEVGEAVDSVTRLLSRLDYRGIFSAEFKRDARNGTFQILEVNTRAWWYVEFAARCGVNVCAMALDDALGREPVASSRGYRAGVGCVNLMADAKAVRALAAGPERLSWLEVLRQWSRACFHVFRWSDPGPSLSVLARAGIGKLRRGASDLTAAVRSRGRPKGI